MDRKSCKNAHLAVYYLFSKRSCTREDVAHWMCRDIAQEKSDAESTIREMDRDGRHGAIAYTTLLAVIGCQNHTDLQTDAN